MIHTTPTPINCTFASWDDLKIYSYHSIGTTICRYFYKNAIPYSTGTMSCIVKRIRNNYIDCEEEYESVCFILQYIGDRHKPKNIKVSIEELIENFYQQYYQILRNARFFNSLKLALDIYDALERL